MKRRGFIVASGSAVLSGLSTSQIQLSAIGLDFEISTPDKDPSKVDSLVIEFEKLEITPKYLDEKEPVNVQVKVEVANQTKRSNEVQTSVVNGGTKNLENNIDSIVVDGLNASSSISGDVTVSIDHPDIQDSYSRQFNVNSSEIPDGDLTQYLKTDPDGRISVVDSKTYEARLPNGTNEVARLYKNILLSDYSPIEYSFDFIVYNWTNNAHLNITWADTEDSVGTNTSNSAGVNIGSNQSDNLDFNTLKHDSGNYNRTQLMTLSFGTEYHVDFQYDLSAPEFTVTLTDTSESELANETKTIPTSSLNWHYPAQSRDANFSTEGLIDIDLFNATFNRL